MKTALLKLFRMDRRPPVPPHPPALVVLGMIRAQIEAKIVPVIADDVDAGYDMALDEVLDIIADYEKALSTQGI